MASRSPSLSCKVLFARKIRFEINFHQLQSCESFEICELHPITPLPPPPPSQVEFCILVMFPVTTLDHIQLEIQLGRDYWAPGEGEWVEPPHNNTGLWFVHLHG